MKRFLLSAVVLAAVLSWAYPTLAAPKGKDKNDDIFARDEKDDKKGKKDKDDGFPFPAEGDSGDGPASFTDDMDKLTEQVGLTEAQVTKLTGLRKKRDDLLAKQSEANEKRIEAARTKIEKLKKESERKRRTRELDLYIKRLDRTKQTMAATQERIMFAALTPAQKAKWNAPILQAEVEKELEPLGLTDEQKTQIQKLCESQAKRVTVPASAKTSATTIKLLASQANLRVLTAEQKREYAKLRAERARDSRRRPKG